ncbi:MAG: type II secretion system F family protein [Thermodesulfovibrionales bacterium]|nr:type II secretion system F family protein [Thermodesulfovibrionales bacterium]
MSRFRYAGYRTDGSKVEGVIEASELAEASIKLKELGIYPKLLIPEKKPSSKRESLVHITRQLSTLLGAGVSLVDALKSIAQECSPSLSGIINEIRDKVSGGTSLWKALEESKLFPEFYINMVKGAEMSGELSPVLEKIALYLESQENIRSRLKTAMIYPSIMLIVAAGMLFFIFLYVMPRIVKIFEDTRASLPLITKILIGITKFIKLFWFLIPLIIIVTIYGIRYLKNKKPELIDKLLLREPLGILLPLYISRFTKTLAFLLEGGVPVIKALEVSARTTGNRIIEKNILQASRTVAEGRRLSASLQGFPPVLVELIATGEKSGILIENLKKASTSYEEEFSRRLTSAINFLEPVMIIVMGIVVLFVVLGVVLPIFELNQLIRL